MNPRHSSLLIRSVWTSVLGLGDYWRRPRGKKKPAGGTCFLCMIIVSYVWSPYRLFIYFNSVGGILLYGFLISTPFSLLVKQVERTLSVQRYHNEYFSFSDGNYDSKTNFLPISVVMVYEVWEECLIGRTMLDFPMLRLARENHPFSIPRLRN